LPVWLGRGVLAAMTGMSAAWLSTHLANPHGLHSPVAPVALALAVAIATLLLQSLGGPIRLIMLLTALPFGATILGVVGLAGAWPALAGRTAGGAGLLWLAQAAALSHRDLYWRGGSLTHVIGSGGLVAALVWAVAAILT